MSSVATKVLKIKKKNNEKSVQSISDTPRGELALIIPKGLDEK